MATTEESVKERKWKIVSGMQQADQTFQGAMKVYHTWVKTYEQDLLDIGYQAHVLVAKYFAKQNVDKNAKILDVAAGTGLCAKELRDKYGYTNIDALDASYDMLHYAKQSNVYKNYYWTKIGNGDKAPFLDDTYDHVTMSGGIAQGQIQVDAFLEMIRITKPGGFIVISTREENRRKVPDYKTLDATLQKHVEDGYWEKVEEAITPQYYMDLDGITWVFRVTKAKPVDGERTLFSQ